jgi:hypothetical protein
MCSVRNSKKLPSKNFGRHTGRPSNWVTVRRVRLDVRELLVLFMLILIGYAARIAMLNSNGSLGL